jgi:hypothetical protein
MCRSSGPSSQNPTNYATEVPGTFPSEDEDVPPEADDEAPAVLLNQNGEEISGDEEGPCYDCPEPYDHHAPPGRYPVHRYPAEGGGEPGHRGPESPERDPHGREGHGTEGRAGGEAVPDRYRTPEPGTLGRELGGAGGQGHFASYYDLRASPSQSPRSRSLPRRTLVSLPTDFDEVDFRQTLATVAKVKKLPTLKKLLGEFGATGLGDLDPKHYEEAYARAKEILAS